MHSAPTETQVRLRRCWVCGSSHTRPWKARTIARELIPEDLRITDSNYGATLALRRCHDCHFIFAEDEQVRSLTGLSRAIDRSGIRKEPGHPRTANVLANLRGAPPSPRGPVATRRGAGSGLLVAEARRQGLDATGVEPSRALVEMARSRNVVEVLPGVFPHPELAERRFDLIFLVDVIEHVSNPLELLRHRAQALNARGVVVVVTPDIGSITARVVGKRWWHFRLAHVGYFSGRSLAAITKATGLTVLKSFRAKWFFRVYYLAERLAEYLPLARLNRLAPRIVPLAWLYQRVLPVNLHDSTVLLLGKDGSSPSEQP